ncbi:hypothetical protein ACFOTA_22315 [Chitinophaga sp. GCM10012297]|uniref:GLPGLI family protein n=1 Tax=Chitinophaga chungangae TaxID=2821488 RepID=A0ABS3YJV0_9BACT|nr:hypothetical protein [Chitinophaga chungangae]MBO9154967.1 hypothetical protein [Chitinophaga chungangae]
MKIRTICLALLAAFSCTAAKAQKVTVFGGKIAAIKDIDTFNCVFDYSRLNVGDMGREANYVKKKRADAEKRSLGSANAWEESWYKDRHDYYEPKFLAEFTKQSEKAAGAYPGAHYQLVFKSKLIEPGGTVTKRTPRLDAEVWIVEASAPTKALVKFRIDDAPGNGAIGDIPSGARIGEAYAKAGKELGALILKETK